MMLLAPDPPLFRHRMRRDDQMLYFMIKPPPDQAAAMDALRLEYRLSRQYAVGRFHLTLLRFGDIRLLSPETLDCICAAAASLEAEPFEISLDRIKGNALVGNRMRALHHFQRALVARLEALDVDVPDYKFKPHASLTYQAWQRRNIPVPPVSWRVGRLLLVNSIHGKGHQSIDSWPLVPRQGCLDL